MIKVPEITRKYGLEVNNKKSQQKKRIEEVQLNANGNRTSVTYLAPILY